MCDGYLLEVMKRIPNIVNYISNLSWYRSFILKSQYNQQIVTLDTDSRIARLYRKQYTIFQGSCFCNQTRSSPIVSRTYMKKFPCPVAQDETAWCRRIEARAIEIEFDNPWLRREPANKFDINWWMRSSGMTLS